MNFNSESEFEKALIKILTTQRGWEETVLNYPTEEDLLKNWANILYNNNNTIDKLNGYPLTDTEMQQIIEQIETLKTPLRLNGFINGGSVSIKRDNTEDKEHFGQEISLKIYSRHEIAAGESRYQIARQPKFKAPSSVYPSKRGDLMLLINGMPVIHIELKKSGIPVSQAYNQIERYSKSSVFTGIFSLIQIFVAMTPEETVYFANPGQNGKFNKDFYFHWADFNNEPLNNWKDIADKFLYIPMAHELIGFYTVPDKTDGILKVMRSYQYFAANAISDAVNKKDWNDLEQKGGYIWHTTGSGKTMTSFKSAQLIATSKKADKVVFLLDRVELGTQTFMFYQKYKNDDEEVQDTENTNVLISKLKSPDYNDTLIVTSIQKMSNIKDEVGGTKKADIDIINSKRIVFVIDECHRDTFGDMLYTIKTTFPKAMFFGFTGTPIVEENKKISNTTADVFGKELQRYTIADGIRDKNVLGFDPYKILIYKDIDLRRQVALEQAKAKTEQEALEDPVKKEIYYKFMNPTQTPMAGYNNSEDKYIKGIEDLLPNTQYDTDEFREKVVEDILNNWTMFSRNNKFHALFATTGICEAIYYYKLLKEKIKEKGLNIKISALFDPNIDNNGTGKYKEESLAEIITDYNKMYNKLFTIPTHDLFKKDISNRLAHKKPYQLIDKTPEEQLDILIVVNQMLTGFDSKWINTLYVDKELRYESIIQAFSRTNRLFDYMEKPSGIIRYYRKPHTMEQNIEKAVKTYCGDRKIGIFVDKLRGNLLNINVKYNDIYELFNSCGIKNFEKLPTDSAMCGAFVKYFNQLNRYIQAAKIQCFKWSKNKYIVDNDEEITIVITEEIYNTLLVRYKEIPKGKGSGGDDIPYDIETNIIEINTQQINYEYMNSRFKKFLKDLSQPNITKEKLEQIRTEFSKSFSILSVEDQLIAKTIIYDINVRNIKLDNNKSFMDYIVEYKITETDKQINEIHNNLGADKELLKKFIESKVTEQNINEFGRFDKLRNSVDKQKAKEYFEILKGTKLSVFQVSIEIDKFLRDYILGKQE